MIVRDDSIFTSFLCCNLLHMIFVFCLREKQTNKQTNILFLCEILLKGLDDKVIPAVITYLSYICITIYLFPNIDCISILY